MTKQLRVGSIALSALGIWLILFAAAAQAVDGVIEIHHEAILAAGGYPYVVTAPGSYVLTSNLLVPSANVHGIQVNADDVQIDLNGFTISGNTNCTRVNQGGGDLDTTCSGTGTGNGIHAFSAQRVTVRNGTIRGIGDHGIALFGGHSRIEGMKLNGNGGDGASLFSNAIVTANSATLNGGSGLKFGQGSVASGNSAVQNGGEGVSGGSVGIVLTGNSAYDNDSVGIRVGGGLARGNSSFANDGYGLVLSINAAYTENVISGNGVGTVSSGVEIGENFCNGNTICP